MYFHAGDFVSLERESVWHPARSDDPANAPNELNIVLRLKRLMMVFTHAAGNPSKQQTDQLAPG
jgi:hypothetical protein